MISSPVPLSPEKVRWYYSKREFFQIVPEFPQRGDFFRCNEVDSLALEAEYRRAADRYQRAWLADYADEVVTSKKDASAKPSGSSPGKPPPSAPSTAAAPPSPAPGPDAPPLDRDRAAFPPEDPRGNLRTFPLEAGPIDEVGEGRGRVAIMGGLHVADLATRCTAPLYWKGSRARLLRGTWFVDRGSGEWAPLRESLAEQLEAAYMNEVYSPSLGNLKLQSDGTMGAKVPLTTKTSERWYALFLSDREAFLCTDSTLSKVKRTFGGAPGYRLRRGYEPPTTAALLALEADARLEEEDTMASLTPVKHLLLVVHGIGQKLEAADVTKDTNLMRQCLRSLEMSVPSDPGPSPALSRDPSTQMARAGSVAAAEGASGPAAEVPQAPGKLLRRGGRVEVLPVQWRREILLDVDSVAEDIMPHGIRGLRTLLATLTVDLMYWLSPLHCDAIVKSVVTQMNAQYKRFICANPDFLRDGGKVSVVGHSLGSVLCFDVLANQPRHYSRIIENIRRDMERSSGGGGETSSSDGTGHGTVSRPPAPASVSAPAGDRGRETEESSKEPGLVGKLASKVKQRLSQSPPPPPRAPVPRTLTAPAPTKEGQGAAPGERRQKLAELDRLETEVARLREQLAFGSVDALPSPGPGDPRSPQGAFGGDGFGAAEGFAAGDDAVPPPAPSASRMTVLEYLWTFRSSGRPGGPDDRIEDEDPATAPAASSQPLPAKPHPLCSINWRPYPAVEHALDASALASAAVAPHRFITFPELSFQVENFFALGSPVAIFLALRGINPRAGRPLGSAAAVKQHAWAFGGVGDCLPAVNRYFNIYHPFDPVGFRLEPLIDPSNRDRRPILLPYYRGGLRIHHQIEEVRIGIDRLATKATATATTMVGSVTSGVTSLFGRVLPTASASAGPAGTPPLASAGSPGGRDPLSAAHAREAGLNLPPLALDGEGDGEGEGRDETDAALSDDPRRGAMTAEELERVEYIWRLTEGPEAANLHRGELSPSHRDVAGRLDFMLQDDPITPSMLSATAAHFCYWNNKDCALFLLRAVNGLHVMDGSAPFAVAAAAAVGGSGAPRAPPSKVPSGSEKRGSAGAGAMGERGGWASSSGGPLTFSSGNDLAAALGGVSS